MADLLPSRIEPLGDGTEQPADSRRERKPQPKAEVKPGPPTPPVDVDSEESHQLDELA